MNPTGSRLPGVLQPVQPSQPFQAVAALPPHEDVVTGPKGQIVVFVLQLHPWVGLPAL